MHHLDKQARRLHWNIFRGELIPISTTTGTTSETEYHDRYTLPTSGRTFVTSGLECKQTTTGNDINTFCHTFFLKYHLPSPNSILVRHRDSFKCLSDTSECSNETADRFWPCGEWSGGELVNFGSRPLSSNIWLDCQFASRQRHPCESGTLEHTQTALATRRVVGRRTGQLWFNVLYVPTSDSTISSP